MALGPDYINAWRQGFAGGGFSPDFLTVSVCSVVVVPPGPVWVVLVLVEALSLHPSDMAVPISSMAASAIKRFILRFLLLACFNNSRRRFVDRSRRSFAGGGYIRLARRQYALAVPSGPSLLKARVSPRFTQ